MTSLLPRVRPATLLDAGEIAACHTALFPGGWRSDAIARLLTADATLAWVAEHDHTVVGFLLASRAADEMEILSIGVAAPMQRRGVATALLSRLLQAAAARRTSGIYLEVGAANAPAQAFYRRHGFCEVGRRRGYYRLADGAEDDALVLRLTPGCASASAPL